MNKIKQWILNREFVQDYLEKRIEENFKVRIPSIFKDAQKDILDTMEDDLEVRAKELADKKLQELLIPIDWNNVVKQNSKKQIYIGDILVDAGRLANLKAEATFLKESDLWKLLNETPKLEAYNSMFVKGETLDDMKKGRSMLYILSQQQNIIDLFQ